MNARTDETWLRIASLVLLLLPASMQAAPSWSTPPTPLSAPMVLINLQFDGSIALDSSANSVAVWNANGIIQAASQVSGGPWPATPTDISAAADYEDVYEPQVVIAPSGTAIAIWASSLGVPDLPRVNSIKTAAQSPKGNWTAPVAIATFTGGPPGGVGSPRLALDASGNALAVWRGWNGTHAVIQAATRPVSGAWSPAVDISPANRDAADPRLAMNSSGRAVAVWRAPDQAGVSLVQAASRQPSDTWSAPVTISASAGQSWNPRVAIDSTGRVVAVWNDATVITAATRLAREQWGPPSPIAPDAISSRAPDVAMDLGGTTTVAWVDANGQVQVATSLAGQDWSTPTQVSTFDDSASEPRVTVNPSGALRVVAWIDNGQNRARVATQLKQSAWSAVVTLGDGMWDSSVEVAATSGYSARALWGVSGVNPGQWWRPVVSVFAP